MYNLIDVHIKQSKKGKNVQVLRNTNEVQQRIVKLATKARDSGWYQRKRFAMIKPARPDQGHTAEMSRRELFICSTRQLQRHE